MTEQNFRMFGCHHTACGRVLKNGLVTTAAYTDVPSQRIEPVRHVIEGARTYANAHDLADPHQGIDYHKVMTHQKLITDLGHEYDRLPMHDPDADKHFYAMRNEVNQQFHHMTHNMGIKVHVTDHDPYKDVHELADDVRNNHQIKVLGTHATGGHAFFSNEENDRFRAVHDLFGHLGTGRDFDRHGEEAAYQAHARMFSPQARGALASETRGQNGSLIVNQRFGPQKIALLPHRLWHPGLARDAVHIDDYDHDPETSWYHGSPKKFKEFKNTPSTTGDWNTSLGTHFSSEEDVARSFGNNMHHVQLQMSNPKIYPSESHMDHEVMMHEFNKGNTFARYENKTEDPRVRGREAQGWSAEHALHEGDFERASENAHHWISNHPDRKGITDRFRKRLTDAGHDGIVYGNEWEKPGHASAIVFDTGQIKHKTAEVVRAPDETESSVTRIATLIGSGGKPYLGMKVIAHVSGNQIDVLHCPFCGTGAVIARSDGTIECGFCTSVFTVQTQPQYNGFPQSVDGQPYEWPGMPQQPGVVPADPPPGTDVNPNSMGVPSPPMSSDPADGNDDMEDVSDDDADSDDDDDKPAFLKGKGDKSDSKSDKKSDKKSDNPFAKKKSYRTASGALVDEADFLAHLAILHAKDKRVVAAKVKAARGG